MKIHQCFVYLANFFKKTCCVSICNARSKTLPSGLGDSLSWRSHCQGCQLLRTAAHQGPHITPGAAMVGTRLCASVGLFLWVSIILTQAPQGAHKCTEAIYKTDAGHTTTLLMVVQRCTGVPVGRTGWILRLVIPRTTPASLLMIACGPLYSHCRGLF